MDRGRRDVRQAVHASVRHRHGLLRRVPRRGDGLRRRRHGHDPPHALPGHRQRLHRRVLPPVPRQAPGPRPCGGVADRDGRGRLHRQAPEGRRGPRGCTASSPCRTTCRCTASRRSGPATSSPRSGTPSPSLACPCSSPQATRRWRPREARPSIPSWGSCG